MTQRRKSGGKHRRNQPLLVARLTATSTPAMAGTVALAAVVVGVLSSPAGALDNTSNSPATSDFTASDYISVDRVETVATLSIGSTVDESTNKSAESEKTADAPVEGVAALVTAQQSLSRTSAQSAKSAHADVVAAERKQARERAARKRALARLTVAPTSNYRITATFGSGGGLWSSGRHTGTDFAAPYGTPIKAVAAGTIVEAGWAGAYGQQVKVLHADGHYTTYSHMSRIVRSSGAVSPGDVIGAIGTTGNTTGPHLHLEVLTSNETAINPLSWLRSRGARV